MFVNRKNSRKSCVGVLDGDSVMGSIAIPVMESKDTKLKIFLSKNEHNQRKLLNFENW